MDKSNNADLIPLAILITSIYENKDDELLSVANKIISENAKFGTLGELLNSNKFTVKAITLKEPFIIPPLKEGYVKGKDLDVRFQLNDIKILDVGEFTTRKEKECCINLEFDYVKISGVYSISGLILDKQFNGGGNAAITLRDVSSEAQIDHTLGQGKETQITNLNFDFDFKSVEFEQTGLQIRDLSQSEIRRILNSVGKLYFKQNMKTLAQKLSQAIRDRFNGILKNKNRDQIIELLHRGKLEF